jgi:hypothetical protein
MSHEGSCLSLARGTRFRHGRQLFGLSGDMATKIDIEFYSDARDALLKAIVE